MRRLADLPVDRRPAFVEYLALNVLHGEPMPFEYRLCAARCLYRYAQTLPRKRGRKPKRKAHIKLATRVLEAFDAQPEGAQSLTAAYQTVAGRKMEPRYVERIFRRHELHARCRRYLANTP